VTRCCVLTEDETSEGVHVDARHHPERIPMSDEVPDLGEFPQVANVRGGAEPERRPPLWLAHHDAEMPKVDSAKRPGVRVGGQIG
jgi:hypothetical protein